MATRALHLLGLLLLLLGPQLAQGGPLYLLAAPNVLRAGSPEMVVVQAQDPGGSLLQDVAVTIRIFDFPAQRELLSEAAATLSSTGSFLAKAMVQVPVNYISSDLAEKQYVVVQAESSLFLLKKTILVSPHTGYLFFQTDKAIYTPGQSVRYRILSVNHMMDPLETTCVIAIQNPEGITLTSNSWQMEKGFYTATFYIPEQSRTGTWKIVAWFQQSPQQRYSTEFEVKEYVLPAFEVELVPDRKFLYLDGERDREVLTFTINARFMFNEPVDGYALAIFGVRTEKQRNSLQESLQRVDITQGTGTATLTLDMLHNAFKNPEELVNAFIFINVTVFSAGGDTVLAEKSGIRIARTPYRIQFFRMPGFFKPGMPFSIRVYVTNVDESPAVGVCVCSGTQQSKTTEEGLAFLNLNTAADQKVLEIEVQTCEVGLSSDQQARVNMTAHAYQTQSGSGNLLHIQADLRPPSVGSTLQLLLQIGQPNKNIKQFTILVLSKGQIVGAWVQPCSQGSAVTGWGLQVEPSMLPSFRVVAFYYLGSGEIVADAVWLGIKDSCMGTLRVGPTDQMDMQRSFRPEDELRLMVTGDARALVGLVAVDQALLALGKKNKLTQKKIWDMVERYDIACSAGSGQNHVGVFTDAGLDMITNIGIRTVARTELPCPQQSRRHRRSLKKLERKTKVDEYETPLERQCCMAGMQESPMGHTCEKRVHRVRQGPSCRAAFLDCCHLSQDLSQEERAQLLLGKSADYEDEEECWEEDCSEEMDMMVRSFFPESWLWKREVLPNTTDSSGIVKHQIKTRLPHSITTWHILAVSMRKDRGICVSAPYTVLVKLPFFVDLRLPLAAIRNEQLELRAVLYNYLSEDVRVRLEFPFQEGLCSAARPEKPARQLVRVPRGAARAVRFVVVPLTLGSVMVEMRASVLAYGLHDSVRKTFVVQPGGEQQRLQRSIILDPRGEPQVELIEGRHLDNLVPDTDAEVFLSVQGNLLGETLLGGLELGGDVLQQLVVLPSGCVEQNIFRVTPNILLTHYLDAMKQWHRIGVDHRDRTIQHILHGYARQMQYRQSDGSYFPYSGSTGSTWLTAYILKVFTMAHPLVNTIDARVLCSSAAWLIHNKQGSEGDFCENAPIYTPAMQGGYLGSEQQTSLTAFVLIALKEAELMCAEHVHGLSSSLQQAQSFLEKRLGSLTQVYSIAISSYALALVNSSKANDVLDLFASHNRTHWPTNKQDPDSLTSVEATAYALLQKVKLGQLEEAHGIARWLVQARAYGGGYESTQTTVVGMQALVGYQLALPPQHAMELRVQVSAPKRHITEHWAIDTSNAYLSRASTKKFLAQDTLQISANGMGIGTVTMLTVYYTLPTEREGTCQAFHLDVTVQDTPKDKKKRNFIDTFWLRIRARAQGEQNATMTIVDISMLTGFYPDLDDLKQLTNVVEQYIFLYETKSTLSNSSVILYFSEMSSEEEVEIRFRIHQQVEAGMLQPATVTAYEYYEPSRRCSRFYNLPAQSGQLKKICQKEVCKCAEESCPQLHSSSRVSQQDLMEAACHARVDNAYKVQLEQRTAKDNYVYYTMRVLDIIKMGTDMDASGQPRRFVLHTACEEPLGLQDGEQYLVMTSDSDLWLTQESFTYVLGKKSYILAWPQQGEVGHQALAGALDDFSNHMKTVGCST